MRDKAHLWTKAAQDSLAKRFGLPNHGLMQDWEWEVADVERFDEFLSAYTSSLPVDQRFSLMEILVQCTEDCRSEPKRLDLWSKIKPVLEQNLDIHTETILYWSRLDAEHEDEMFGVSPLMRRLANENNVRALDCDA